MASSGTLSFLHTILMIYRQPGWSGQGSLIGLPGQALLAGWAGLGGQACQGGLVGMMVWLV